MKIGEQRVNKNEGTMLLMKAMRIYIRQRYALHTEEVLLAIMF